MEDEGIRFELYCEVCGVTEEITRMTVVQWELVSRLTREAHQHTAAERGAYMLASARAGQVAEREDRDDEGVAL